MLIIVEGYTDQDFIELYFDFLVSNNKSLSNIKLTDKNFAKTEGKDNLSSAKPRIDKALCKGERVLIIFDTNDDKQKSLDNIHNQLDLLNPSWKKQCEIFLIPNNQDKGNLETLLENIAKEKCILKCFDDYIKCITRLQNQNSKIKLPEKKSKVFAYLSSFDIKIDENFQLNEDIWDLQNPYLNNLKNFLIQEDKIPKS